LDGATAALAKGLVDKAISAEQSGISGIVCIDRKTDITKDLDYGTGSGEWDLHRAALMSAAAGFPVIEDANVEEFGTSPAPLRCDGAALYAGWYSLNHYNDAFSWNTGAIGFHLESSSAADPRGGPNWSANAILHGITITAGAVAEPFLSGLGHPDGIFRNLFEGANAGDALLRNTELLKWMDLFLGDPLYRPFPSPLPSVLSPQNSLLLSPQVLVGGGSSQGAVVLGQPAPAGGLTFSLKSSKPAFATVPAGITIPAGASSATFPITTHTATVDQALLITATSGPIVLSNTLVPQPLLGALSIAPTTVTGGAGATGTIFLNAPSPGITVNLTSSNTAAASVPTTFTAPAGATTATFPISTSPVAANTSSSISAVYAGATVRANVAVRAPTLSVLTLSAASVSGGVAVSGTLTLSGPAPSNGATVSLVSSIPAVASVPATVTVPAGAATAGFTVSTAPVTALKTVTITGTLTTRATARLQVKP